MSGLSIRFAERSPEVRAAFVQVGYGYVGASNFVVVVLVLFVVGALRDSVHPLALIAWAAAQLLNQAARRWLAYRHAVAPMAQQSDTRWWSGLIGSTVASAVIHALFAVAVLDLRDGYVTTIVFLVSFAMTGGGLTFVALSLVQLYAYVGLMLGPLAIVSFASVNQVGMHALWLGLLTVWMAYCCIRYGRSLFRLNLQQIGQRFKLAEQARALAMAQQQAEEANHAKTRFVAAASHDLRQPLQALGTYSSLLEGTEDQRDARDLAAKMEVLLQSLEHSLDSLNDICKLDAGALSPHPDDVPLQDIIDRAVVAVMHAAQMRSLELRVRRTSAWVRTDPALCERIVVNLLSNAIRYTQQGRIVIGARRVGSQRIRLDVYDTGIGIDPADIDLAFKQYRRLHEGPQGLGLGLAIVRQLADLLGHRVEVDSRPRQGSRFSIAFDRVRASARELRTPTPSTFAPTFAGSAILLIEDEPAVRDSLRAIFERWGCVVVALASGEQALARIAGGDRSPDLIVADYNLGTGMTGSDAIEVIREHEGRPIPAILISGQVDRKLQCPAPGVVLSKPVAPSALRASVNGLLE